MPIFWVKIDHDDRLSCQPNIAPGNRKMLHNTPQAMGKDVLGTFMPQTDVIAGPGGSENGCFGGKKQPK